MTRPAGQRAPEPTEKRHPIQVVAQRTGLTRDLLRAWERRYGVVEPGRTEGGRRLYSDRDVEHLRLLREATRMGRRIGDVSGLTREVLERLVWEDREAALRRRDGRGDAEAPSPVSYLQDCLAAVRGLDGPRLEATLGRAVVALRPLVFVEEVAAPLMREVGELWRRGLLTPGRERLASGAVRATLGEMVAALQVDAGPAPGIVVATPEGQAHELGAMLAAVAAAEVGWRVTYLGGDLPVTDIAAAARETGARAVALSIVYPGDDPGLSAALRKLDRALPSGVDLFVGGASSDGYRGLLEEIGARVPPNIRSFQAALRASGGHLGPAGGGAP